MKKLMLLALLFVAGNIKGVCNPKQLVKGESYAHCVQLSCATAGCAISQEAQDGRRVTIGIDQCKTWCFLAHAPDPFTTLEKELEELRKGITTRFSN